MNHRVRSSVALAFAVTSSTIGVAAAGPAAAEHEAGALSVPESGGGPPPVAMT